MAIILEPTNTLILEPAKCGTTWIGHAIRAARIPTRKPSTIGDCCSRHSFRHNYAGEFDCVLSPVRHPDAWLLSWYDYHRSKSRMTWQPTKYYPHKPFGSYPPATFSAFVEHVVETPECLDYLAAFACSADYVIRQEQLTLELMGFLNSQGYPAVDIAEVALVPPHNESERVSSWGSVPADLRSAYVDGTREVRQRWYGE